ncbi:MAG: hypothetical protein WCG93_04300 [Paludibacter sp.]
MRRIASQYTFCSPQQILRRMVVEQDDHNVVKRLFSLDDSIVESSQTLFFDGIISTDIVSLKQIFPSVNVTQLLENYNYIDFSILPTSFQIIPTEKPLLLDFNTQNSEVINQILPQITDKLAQFSVFEIIAACTYFPLFALERPTTLGDTYIGKLLLWENVDLPNKKITEHSRVRQF